MKQKVYLVILSIWTLLLVPFSEAGIAHVIPEDELRNKVYLSKLDALKSVFKGISKIKYRKDHLTKSKIEKIKGLTGQPPAGTRLDYYYGIRDDGQKLFAFISKAQSNSHPPSQAVFITLVDEKGAVQDVKIMEYRGPQRAEIISPSFLKQFIGKTAKSDFASISSNQGRSLPVRSLAKAVHKIAAKVLVLTGKQ
ncbi:MULTISPECIES: hypothetical protein [unclassified Nitrospina]|uniref:hypothetical protein n=1 Tax=unclassified Nitrospina TaxID=2638683 RepID=UPI003F9933B7